MMKEYLYVLIIVLFVVLSGCFHRNEETVRHLPNEKILEQVQRAVDDYYDESGGLLPIKTADSETDPYMKYRIDFKKLIPDYLMQVPPNAFEKGGIFQYVIIHPETKPEVKVIDLRITETIRTIHMRLKTMEYPPYKDHVGANVFTLDYQKLGFDEEPFVISPFTGSNLPLVITGDGKVIVDYRSDLYQQIRKRPELELEEGMDIRWILTEDSPFSPAYSVPYTLDDEREPIFFN